MKLGHLLDAALAGVLVVYVVALAAYVGLL